MGGGLRRGGAVRGGGSAGSFDCCQSMFGLHTVNAFTRPSGPLTIADIEQAYRAKLGNLTRRARDRHATRGDASARRRASVVQRARARRGGGVVSDSVAGRDGAAAAPCRAMEGWCRAALAQRAQRARTGTHAQRATLAPALTRTTTPSPPPSPLPRRSAASRHDLRPLLPRARPWRPPGGWWGARRLASWGWRVWLLGARRGRCRPWLLLG